jgi:hypothetical protein
VVLKGLRFAAVLVVVCCGAGVVATAASAAPSGGTATTEPDALRQYKEYVEHTGLTDPAAMLAQARRDLDAVRALRSAALTRGDEAAVAELDVRVSGLQQEVFSLRSQVLTYKQLRAAAKQTVRATSLPVRPTTRASVHRKINVGSFAVIAVAAMAVLVFILAPVPAMRRRRWS